MAVDPPQPWVKRDSNDVLTVPPVMEPFAQEYEQRELDEDGYMRLGYFEAKQLLERLDSLGDSVTEPDGLVRDDLRRVLGTPRRLTPLSNADAT